MKKIRDSSARAAIFLDLLSTEYWAPPVDIKVPIPKELKNINIWEDQDELQEALTELNKPPTLKEIVSIRKKLKLGTSSRPTGVGYEVWSEVLKTIYCRIWFQKICARALDEGKFPNDAESIPVVPAFKGKGEGEGKKSGELQSLWIVLVSGPHNS